MHRPVAFWLFLCCFMVFATAQIGAITRLTESGLSITEWKPVAGVLPPLNDAQWQHAFDLYKQSPEFAAKHFWMNLSDFKHIFFWEWLHRLWDRIIGVAFLLPFLWFLYKRQLPPGFSKLLLLIFAVGCVEGFMGWYMVQSGLIHRPSVSHFRLAVHLSLALLIYSAMLWTGLSLLSSPSPLRGEGRDEGESVGAKCEAISPAAPPLILTLSPPGRGNMLMGRAALILLALTIIWGAFVAGLHAGLAYNTFPTMNGHWLPPEPFSAAAPFVNPAWVQFTHRWLAKTTALVIIAYAVKTRNAALGAMAAIQAGLGIATLLSQAWLPLAVLHQAGAMILLTLLLMGICRMRWAPAP